MPVTVDQPAPYAPASAIVDLIQRHRNKGLPSPVDADVLARAQVSDSLIPRTLQALRTLDLITEDGRPSQVLEGIRLAPESEYKQRLAEWLNAAYADALVFVDPSTDDETAIRDAFRKYVPTGQQSRMVTLFMGLFTAAGVMPERQKQAPPRKGATSGSVKPSIKARTAPKPSYPGSQQQERTSRFSNEIPPALAGLLSSLPSEGEGWTKEQRDKFVTTFGVVVDYCIPLVAAGDTNTATGQ